MYKVDSARIRDRIEELGYNSVDSFAKDNKFVRSTLYTYLSGKSVLPSQFERLLDTLGLPVEEAIVRQGVAIEDSLRIIAPVVDSLVKIEPAYCYVLFGSRTRLRCRRYADFDIGVYHISGIEKPSMAKLIEAKVELENDFPYFIDLVNLSKASHSFLLEISKTWLFVAGARYQWIELNNEVVQ